MSDNIHHKCREIMAELGKKGEIVFWGDFTWPDKRTLTMSLADVLEKNIVDEKYYLSKKTLKGYVTYSKKQSIVGNGFKFSPKKIEDKGTAITITTRAGGRATDNYLLEKIRGVGQLGIKGSEGIKRVYSPTRVSPTLTTMQGGNHQPKIIEDLPPFRIAASRGRNIDTSTAGKRLEQRLEINKNGTSNTITTVQKDNYVLIPSKPSCNTGVLLIENVKYRVRKLTPRECLRLQDFPDSFKTVVSDSQVYKQAGNSMSVNVLEMIFKQIEKSKKGSISHGRLF